MNSGDYERQRKQRQQQLIGKESCCATNPDVTGMNVTDKIDRHKIVAQLPEKVRKKDQKRATDPNPKPFAFQIAAQIREQYGNHHTSDADNHGVLRQHTETD